MSKRFPVNVQKLDMCPNGCGLFTGDEVACPCGANRYEDSSNRVPAATMSYLPLNEQLAVFLGYPESRALLDQYDDGEFY